MKKAGKQLPFANSNSASTTKNSEIDMSKIHNDFSSFNGKLRRVSKNGPYLVIKF